MGTTTLNLASGSRIGDYVIEREDDGGYQAAHVLLPRRVHLGVMHPTFVGLRPVAVRMMREACILEALRHPGVPRIYEVGVLADQRTQRPWVASELVEGESLAATLLAGDYIPVVELLAILRDVGDVLAHAHSRNVAHRGIRPDAIVRSDGARGFPLCVINWGDARVPDVSEDADRAFADDIFALGLVADLVLASRRGLPAKVLALVDDLMAPNPMSRPTAADVASRAKAMLDVLDAPPLLADDDLIEESVVFVSRLRPPPVPPRAARSTPASPARATRPTSPPPSGTTRLRWTPPLGVTEAASTAVGSSAGIPIGRLERG